MKKLPKKKIVRKKKFQKGSLGIFFTFLIVALLIVGSMSFVGGIPSNYPNPTGKEVMIVTPTQEVSKNSLQLETFGFITITPTPIAVPTVPSGPKKSCGPEDDNGVKVPTDCRCLDASVTCKNGQPYDDNGNPLTGKIGDPPVAVSTLCGSTLAPSDGRYCVAKPVIYLYPTQPQLVSVSVASTGQIVVSDPTYPPNGWQDVMAFPNGNLFYNGKQYNELFYETNVTDFAKPKKGIIISRDALSARLNEILDNLGLNKNEKSEFLSYWLPRLQQFTTPYIYFSLLDASTKNKVDSVSISPKPDTQIAFISYFKPVTDPASYDNSLTLGKTPVRHGFVSVEWGGVIDNN